MNLKFIELFSGIGGIRLGLESAAKELNYNTECVFASELDKFCNITYKENFKDAFEISGDITKINKKNIPDHDLLLAGFPCQAFSQAGKKQGFNDTRGTLFFEIQRVLEVKKPKYFLLENVKQLIGHDKRDKKDKIGRTFKIILNILEDKLGYNVYWDNLNAKDFNLPQNRNRVYIFGSLKKVNFKFPEKLFIETRVGKILDKKFNPKYIISDRLWESHQRRKKENKLKGKGFGYGIVNNDSTHTNTISARYNKDGSEILIENLGTNPRKLTPREAARLQGFPDEFIINKISDTQAYKQFGNSVPVPVIKNIFLNNPFIFYD